MRLTNKPELKAGQIVRLDEGFANSSLVEVISQTPLRLYTKVKSDGVEWEVSTYRLNPIEPNEKE